MARRKKASGYTTGAMEEFLLLNDNLPKFNSCIHIFSETEFEQFLTNDDQKLCFVLGKCA